jgi:hypothetical protein
MVTLLCENDMKTGTGAEADENENFIKINTCPCDR